MTQGAIWLSIAAVHTNRRQPVNQPPSSSEGLQPLQLLNEVQAGEYLSLSHRTLQNWRVKGGGPKYRKIGAKTVRYHLLDLQVWLDATTRSNTSHGVGK